MTSSFAAFFIALYVGHHVGDYWVQTDEDAKHKGDAGRAGGLACLRHVVSYLMTQTVFLGILVIFLDVDVRSWVRCCVAIFVSGVTHYTADRREHGLMFKLARLIPGKARFLALGTPRPGREIELWGPCSTCEGRGTSYDESTGGKCWDCRAGGMLPSTITITDNPSLGTGAWALDQSWHLALGVFVPALILAT